MSYDLSLVDPVSEETLQLESKHQMQGGTYAVGGTTEASLNITWNYGEFYYRIFGDDGIRTLHRKTGLESIPILEDAISKLGNETTDNYWDKTEGNAKRPLLQLLTLAKMRPDGVWTVYS